jgi:Lipocalin-like domain
MRADVCDRDLLGAWTLESWSLVYEDGRPQEYPLGADARGLIMYTADGHVSATLMRAVRPKQAPASTEDKAQAYDESFAYAGRFEVKGGAVYHTIQIATNPALIGFTSTRHIQLSAPRLVLSGPDFTSEYERTQRIAWVRV